MLTFSVELTLKEINGILLYYRSGSAGGTILTVEDELFKSNEDKYGASYKAHYLEIYKMYVEMADKISSRRQTANSFFLTINTTIVGLLGYVQLGKDQTENTEAFYWLIGLAGMVLCFLWYRLVRSYKDINSGKFKVIHEIEKRLPLAPYDAEWEILGRGKDPKLYLPFTHIEVGVPWVFFTLHFFILVRAILSIF